MLEDAAERFFRSRVDTANLLVFEQEGLDEELRAQAAALGLNRPAESTDPQEAFRAGALVLRVGGRHAAPLPLAEEIVAAQLASAAGIELPGGIVGVGLDYRAPRDSGMWSCEVPFGRNCGHFLVARPGPQGVELALLATAGATSLASENVAGEPRDRLSFDKDDALARVHVEMPEDIVSTLLAAARTSQMAGALETILALAVEYAREREQFGRKIGKFQAIQQQLAILAGQVAAAGVAAADAARALDQRGLPKKTFGALDDPAFEIAVAKVVVGEAAEFGPRIAHQVLGAIGFTHEHRLHFFTRRLWAWRAECGSAASWAQRLGAFGLDGETGGLWEILTDRSGESGSPLPTQPGDTPKD